VGVTQNDANLRGSSTLLGELANLLDNLVGGGLEPRRGGARVGNGGGRNALTLAVKSTHLVGVVLVMLLTEVEKLRPACSIVKFPSSKLPGLVWSGEFFA
jgi:hypothetical protein